MSEEVLAADSLVSENAELRRALEVAMRENDAWHDAYDRLAGAFDLHIDILECKQALADLAGSFYDVVLAELARRAERAEAVVAAAQAYQAAIDGLNGISATEQALWAALDSYEQGLRRIE